MKKYLFYFFLSAMLVIAPETAQAQFSQTYVQKYWIEYLTPESINFSFKEVASALDVTPEELAAELDMFANKSESRVNFQIEDSLGNTYPNAVTGYTQGTQGGFWMTTDGVPVSWGTTDYAWYNMLAWDVLDDADLFTIKVGQRPNYFIDGGEANAHFILSYDDKQVTFDIKLVVYAKHEITAEQQISKLNIVGEKDLVIDMHEGQKASTTVTVNVDGIAGKLGLETSELANNMESFVFGHDYDTSTEEWLDQINGDYNCSPTPGFWFARTYDETTDEYKSECYPLYISSGDDASPFYTSGYTLSEDGSELTVTAGQNTSVCYAGDKFTTDVYIINYSNAYKFNVVFNVLDKLNYDISDKACAGTTDYTVSMDNDVTTGIEVSVPLDSIAGLLGVEEDKLVYLAWNSDNELTDNYTANYGGFWFDRDSHVCAFQADGYSMYVEPVSATDMSHLLVGQWQAFNIPAGESQTSQLYLMGDNKYYVLNFTLSINPVIELDSVDVDTWHVVKTFDYSIVLAQNEGYSQTKNIQTDWDAIKAALELDEVDDESFFTWSEAGQTEWDPYALTKNYTCGPYPGFWMNDTGDANYQFSSDCAYGVSFGPGNGIFTFYVHPSSGHVTGEEYEGQFFVVNVLNGNVVQVNTHISYIASRFTLDEVGSTTLNVALTDDMINSNGLYQIAVSLTDIMTKLGISEEDQEFEYYSCQWYADSKVSGWQQIESFELEDCLFQENGELAHYELENEAFALGYDYETGSFLFSLFGEKIAQDAHYFAKVALEYGGKAYSFVFTISSATADAVNGIQANVKSAAVTTLDGRTLSSKAQLHKNVVYIKNGKKYLVR